MKAITVLWHDLGSFGYSNQCLFCHNTKLVEGSKYCRKYGLPLAVFEIKEFICSAYKNE